MCPFLHQPRAIAMMMITITAQRWFQTLIPPDIVHSANLFFYDVTWRDIDPNIRRRFIKKICRCHCGEQRIILYLFYNHFIWLIWKFKCKTLFPVESSYVCCIIVSFCNYQFLSNELLHNICNFIVRWMKMSPCFNDQ